MQNKSLDAKVIWQQICYHFNFESIYVQSISTRSELSLKGKERRKKRPTQFSFIEPVFLTGGHKNSESKKTP